MVEDQGIDTLDDLSNERDWPKTFDGIDEFFHKYYKAMAEDQCIDTLDDLPIERLAKDL